MTPESPDACDQCNDTRTVPVRRCRPTCSKIRGCAADCPATILVACPACERRSLGEDLA